jgi:hypothetical protein
MKTNPKNENQNKFAIIHSKNELFFHKSNDFDAQNSL